MKKLHLLLMLALPVLVTAQDKIKFGINAGATLSDIIGTELRDNYNYGFNYLVGVSADIPLTERLSLSANINYERKSPTRKITFRNDLQVPNPGDPAFALGTFRFTSVLNYIAVPVSVKYYIDPKKNFYISGGAFAAFLVDDNMMVNGSRQDSTADSAYKSVDFGLNAGFGTRIKLTETQNLNIEIRDNLGLANISSGNYNGSDKIRTNSINLIANWQFDL